MPAPTQPYLSTFQVLRHVQRYHRNTTIHHVREILDAQFVDHVIRIGPHRAVPVTILADVVRACGEHVKSITLRPSTRTKSAPVV
jgi:hypothetical protein